MAGEEKRLSFSEVYQVLEKTVEDDAVQRRKNMQRLLDTEFSVVVSKTNRILMANDEYNEHLTLASNISTVLRHIAVAYGVAGYRPILTKVEEIKDR